MPIYDAAMLYEKGGVPLVMFAGIEYGNGSSRDWAAKGTNLLGVRAVIAQSSSVFTVRTLSAWAFRRLPSLRAAPGARSVLKVTRLSRCAGSRAAWFPGRNLRSRFVRPDGASKAVVPLTCRIDTLDELEYFRNGGILQYVLRQLAA